MGETVRVRRVIDADTIELDRADPTGTYPFERVRMPRIAAPELDARNARVRARQGACRPTDPRASGAISPPFQRSIL